MDEVKTPSEEGKEVEPEIAPEDTGGAVGEAPQA